MAQQWGFFFEGMKQVLYPQELPNLEKGLFFLIVSGMGNLILGLVMVRVGRRTKSLVLEADGRHLLTDVYTSGAVLIGVVVVYLTGWYRFDGIIACFAGANIIFWGSRLVRQGFGGLMHAAEPELLEEICDLLTRHKRDIWIDAHRLRAWRSGKWVNVDFHLVLPRELPLQDAHREVKDLERVFSDHFGGTAEILIHLDPCAAPECPVCNNDPCDLRQQGARHQKIWKRETLTCHSPGHQ